MNHLQSPGIVSQSHMSQVVLPSDEDHDMFPQENEDGSVDRPLQCSYVLHDAADSLWHVTNILSMLGDISMEAATSHNAIPAFQDYLAWLLDSFLSIHEMRKRWQTNPTLHQSGKKSVLLSFCAVHALLSSLRASVSDTIVRKGYVVIAILCSAVLEEPADLSEESTKLALCSTLLNLVAICRQQDTVLREVSVHLIPGIQAILQNESASTVLGKDFQASTFCYL